MSTNPWSADSPEPGDFDAVLATIDASCVSHHAGDASATLRMLVSVDGDDVRRLERLARARGETVPEVVAGLLRDADRDAAPRG